MKGSTMITAIGNGAATAHASAGRVGEMTSTLSTPASRSTPSSAIKVTSGYHQPTPYNAPHSPATSTYETAPTMSGQVMPPLGAEKIVGAQSGLVPASATKTKAATPRVKIAVRAGLREGGFAEVALADLVTSCCTPPSAPTTMKSADQ
jgi:hypothetical protein